MGELMGLIFKLDFKGLFITPTENGLIKFFRYAFVGGIAFVVDYLFFALMSIILGDSRLSLNIAVVMGFVGGIITNFVLSKKLVFTENANVGNKMEFIAYTIIGIIGCLINMLLMNIAVGIMLINKYIAKVIVALIVLVYNYLARKILLYR